MLKFLQHKLPNKRFFFYFSEANSKNNQGDNNSNDKNKKIVFYDTVYAHVSEFPLIPSSLKLIDLSDDKIKVTVGVNLVLQKIFTRLYWYDLQKTY
jgi:hypothetical protein